MKEKPTKMRRGIESFISKIRRDRRKKVTIALKKLATSEKTLKDMVGMSLSERCIFLHRMMPDVMIKRTTLSRIYKEHGVKFKKIKKVKVVPEHSK